MAGQYTPKREERPMDVGVPFVADAQSSELAQQGELSEPPNRAKSLATSNA
ncbi:MAG: hypothetical protein LW822_04770 [Phycisphaeraceae bacterium]|nr:hypothetical protein [Phycisphaeraceae bacterium]